jgi:hypothetical protein
MRGERTMTQYPCAFCGKNGSKGAWINRYQLLYKYALPLRIAPGCPRPLVCAAFYRLVKSYAVQAIRKAAATTGPDYGAAYRKRGITHRAAIPIHQIPR